MLMLVIMIEIPVAANIEHRIPNIEPWVFILAGGHHVTANL
jgi:hypothetical protein